MVATLLLATGDIELASEDVDEACARALAHHDGAPGGLRRVALCLEPYK